MTKKHERMVKAQSDKQMQYDQAIATVYGNLVLS